MPHLLRNVLCVIETFHKYAREDGDKATLTCRELKQLLQGEFGDLLQPHIIHAVERNLNHLDIDSDGTIYFDEFVTALFSLLNLCYHEIQALLHLGSSQVSKSEKPDDVDLQAASQNGHQTARTLPSQEKMDLPAEMSAAAQFSHEEDEAVEHNRTDPQEDIKTYNLPWEAYEPNDPKNQHLEGDEQDQEQSQDTPALGHNRTPLKISKLTEESKHTSSTKDIPREEDRPVRRQSDTKIRDWSREQKEYLKIQETTQKLLEDQEVAAEKGIKSHSKTQEPFLQRKDRIRLETTVLPGQAATRKPFHIQKSTDPEDDGRIPETQEPGKDADRRLPETTNLGEPEIESRTSESQDCEHETKGWPAQVSHRKVSDTIDMRAETNKRQNPEAHETAEQTETERKTQAPIVKAQIQDGKDQEFQGSSKQKDTEKGSAIQDLSSEEENQDHPELEGASVSEEDLRHAEEGIAEGFVPSKDDPATEKIPGTRETTQELAPLRKQFEGKRGKSTKTHDTPIKEEDDYDRKCNKLSVTQVDEESCEMPKNLTPEEVNNSSKTGELHVQQDSRGQVDSCRRTLQEGHPNNSDLQKQRVPDEDSRVDNTGVLSAREDVQLPEEQRQPTREGHKSLRSGTESPGVTVEPDQYTESQKFTAGGQNRRSLEAGIAGGLDAHSPGHVSVPKIPGKESDRKELKVQGPETEEEEGGTPVTQETLFKSLDEDKSAFSKTHLKTEEPATLEEEDEGPQEPVGEGDNWQSNKSFSLLQEKL
ncbi:trichohyalin-like protein 1 [Dipodomys spectabilis]|uniref:trichohyalin-like protein 1 n=1 Tax=Dipodomys spectabilis TaxID=105255 RepID=UPI001C539DCF|nr:trichohyalin-like protein 1 [Dipodomys spectabilis]